MFACSRSTSCLKANLISSVRPHARNYHLHSRSVARGLQDNAWWLLPVALVGGGYGYYKHRQQLWTGSRVSFNAADQPNGQDEFRVTLTDNKNDNMDLKRDAEKWMPHDKDIGISNTRRAVVFSIGMAGKESHDLYVTS